MREIKFRAWDDWSKQDKRCKSEMLYFDKYCFNTELFELSWECRYEKNIGAFGRRLSPDFKLMQFTGLKDKNGKEIYEGDIVESEDGTAKYKVVFEDGCFEAKSLQLKEFYADVSRFQAVIGNIYENPNLLKKQNGA